VKKKKEKDIEEVYSLQEELDKAKPYTEMYKKAYDFNTERFNAYAELMAFYQGNQHLLKKYKTDRPWVVNMNTPYATVAIENRIASILVNDYEGDLIPLSPEDIDIIEPIDRVYKREWERLDIDRIIRNCVETSAVVREAYCHIILDDKKIYGGTKRKRVGALTAEIIEPSRVLIDPTARNLKDANYMVVLGRISKKEALKNYSKLESLKLQAPDYTPNQRGEVYYDNDYSTEQEDVFTVWNFYQKEDGKIKKTKLINNIIVKESTLDITRFPIAQLRWKKAAQSCYGISLMDQLLSLQKAINAIESAITNTAIAYAAPSMMVAKGSGVDPKVVAKSNGAPGVVYSVNGNLDNAIKPVVPPKIQDEILSIKQDFEAKIREISGNSNQFMGNIGTAANTVGGAEVAVERAKIIEVNIINNIEDFVEEIVNILVEFIIKMYPNAELTYSNGKDGEGAYNFDVIKMPKKSEMKDLEYKFYIELDKKSQYSKDKQKQALMDLFQFERQYDAPVKTITVSDIIKNSDLINKDEIIARYNSLNSQDAQTKAETIDKLINTANNMGIPQDLIVQATAEIISGGDEHPATDQLMQMIEQGFSQQLQEVNAQADMGAIAQEDAESMQDPTAGLDPNAVAQAEAILGSEQAPIM
jgi:hypothetical protein